MPDALRAPAAPGLSEIADEFKELDGRRRGQGLSLSEAERYNALFARLSEVLASNESQRFDPRRGPLRCSGRWAPCP